MYALKSCVICEVVHQWFACQTLFAEDAEGYNVLRGISNSVACTCIHVFFFKILL